MSPKMSPNMSPNMSPQMSPQMSPNDRPRSASEPCRPSDGAAEVAIGPSSLAGAQSLVAAHARQPTAHRGLPAAVPPSAIAPSSPSVLLRSF